MSKIQTKIVYCETHFLTRKKKIQALSPLRLTGRFLRGKTAVIDRYIANSSWHRSVTKK